MKTLTPIFLIPLLLFMTGCTINWNDEKEKFITKNIITEPEHLSCHKDSDCKVLIVKSCCSDSFTSTNISYTGQIISPRDCRNIDCAAPEYQPRIEYYESVCEESVCKTRVK